MDAILKILAQHSSEILLLLLVVMLVHTILVIRLSRQAARSHSRWQELLPEGRGETIETMLYDHLRERMRIEEDLGDVAVYPGRSAFYNLR